jgi:hypothetical protein
MKLHSADHQSKAVWEAMKSRTVKSISKITIAARSVEELEKLSYNHVNNLLGPPTSTESDTDGDNLPSRILPIVMLEVMLLI